MRQVVRPLKRNLRLKFLIWFVLGTSFSFLLVNADLVINPQITNSIAYIKQFFVTSDGTSSGTVGVVLQSSGVFATKYCDLSGANCKTISQLSDISTQLAGLSAIYMTSGQVDSKISLFSGSITNYLTGNFYDKSYITGNFYDKSYITGNFYDKLYITGTYYDKTTIDANFYDKSYITGTYYDKTTIDAKGYLTGANVNALAKTLPLACSEGQIVKMVSNTWTCASDAIGSPQDLSSYATISSLSNYATISSLSAYATTSSLSNYATISSLSAYATTSSLSNYATTSSLSNYATTGSLSGYYTKSTIDNIFNNYYQSSTIDSILNDYYTASTIDAKGYLLGSQVNSLAKTLSLSCGYGDVPYYTPSGWTCYAVPTDSYTSSSWASTTNNSTNWDTAYGWGNHATQGYITSSVLSNYATTSSLGSYVALSQTGNWNTAYTFVNTANDSDTLKLDGSNNRVGVLTSSPYKTFVAAGDVALLSNTNLSALEILSNGAIPHRRGISLDNDPNGKFSFYIHSSQNDAAFNFKDGSSDTILMTILEGGNVGIGTSSAPGYKLTVEGTGAFTHSVYAPAFLYNSDKRLKTNIFPILNPLLKIDQLNGYTFDWKSTGNHDIGVIAQEVESVFPEAVVTKEDGYKSVSYPSLVAPLISAVKELYHHYLDQQSQIDQLKIEIHQLKLEISKK